MFIFLVFLIRLLENELQKVQKNAELNEKELRSQIEELKKDNDRQQKLIGQVVSHVTCILSNNNIIIERVLKCHISVIENNYKLDDQISVIIMLICNNTCSFSTVLSEINDKIFAPF